MSEESKSRRPSHRLYAVLEAGAGAKPIWREIGAAWVQKDGEGFNISLDYLPLQPGVSMVMRPIPKRDASETAPEGPV